MDLSVGQRGSARAVTSLFITRCLGYSPVGDCRVLCRQRTCSHACYVILPMVPLVGALGRSVRHFLHRRFSNVNCVRLRNVFIHRPHFRKCPSIFKYVFNNVQRRVMGGLVRLVKVRRAKGLLQQTFGKGSLAPLSGRESGGFYAATRREESVAMKGASFRITTFCFPRFRCLLCRARRTNDVNDRCHVRHALITSTFRVLRQDGGCT